MGKHKTVKTTITIEEDLWIQFSIIVLKKYGGRKKTEVVEQLIREYVKNNKES